MKSFLGNIASAFVKVVDDEPSVQQPVQNMPEPARMSEQMRDKLTVQSAASTTKLDQELVGKLIARLDQEKLPAPNYLEFKDALQKPELLCITDERSRMTMVFAVLKAGYPQLTKDILLSSIKVYCDKLDSWQAEAVDSLNTRREEIPAKKEEVLRIQKQIGELTARIGELNDEIRLIEDSCDRNERSMIDAVNTIKKVFLEDQTKISDYITA